MDKKSTQRSDPPSLKAASEHYVGMKTATVVSLCRMRGNTRSFWNAERKLARTYLEDIVGYRSMSVWAALAWAFRIAQWVSWIIRELKREARQRVKN